MSKLRLNKSELRRLEKDLETYSRFLPALELRRSQLMAVRLALRAEREQLERELAEARRYTAKQLPMLASAKIHLNRLVAAEAIQLRWENVAGISLPALDTVSYRTEPYSLFASPVWLEAALAAAKQQFELALKLQVLDKRCELLERAITKTTQRVNLFEQVLIPETRENCRKIRIYLSDEETSAVVRAKLAKAKSKESAA